MIILFPHGGKRKAFGAGVNDRPVDGQSRAVTEPAGETSVCDCLIEGLKKESSLDGYRPFLCSVKEMGGTVPNQLDSRGW